MPNQTISLRPIGPNDEPFLLQLYATTLPDALYNLNISPQQLDVLIQLQFAAQHTQYQQQFRQAAFDLILLNDEPIGRLYLDRKEHELRLIEISLLPQYRNKGIGSVLLQDILEESAALHKPVRLQVVIGNRAQHLYSRLGFCKIGHTESYVLMESSHDR